MGWLKKEAPPTMLVLLALAGVATACLMYSFSSGYTKEKNKVEAMYKELQAMEKELAAPEDKELGVYDDKPLASEKAGLLPK